MIELQSVTIQAGELNIGPIDVSIPPNTYAVLSGPTGAGKTSLIEAVVGIRALRSGHVRIGGVDVTQFRPADRRIGYVPQHAVLFRGMNVRANLEFGLRVARVHAADRNSRVDEMADGLEIGSLMDRSIEKLSGGERARVALGRAMILRPTVLVMDEPLAALDPNNRQHLHDWICHWRQRWPCTVLHISHQVEDSVALADQIIRLRAGQIVA